MDAYVYSFYTPLVGFSLTRREVKPDTLLARENKVNVNRQGFEHQETLLPRAMALFGPENSRVPDQLKFSGTPKDAF